MLRPGWVLERYYGWSVASEAPSLKVLTRRYGPFTKLLLLAHGASEDEIADASLRHGLSRPLSFVVLNDFGSRSEEESRTIAGVKFTRVTSGRWFGIGTFILDLAEDLDTLFARTPAKERNECRKAQKLGVRVEFITRPRDQELRAFFQLYGRMARERCLEVPRSETIRRMFAGDDLMMIRCKDSRDRSLVVNLVYLQNDQAYYLFSARDHAIPGGAGRYAHWETIRVLKRTGFRWYDLGLVRSSDESDGIYWFKRSFGGTFIDFGREYQHAPRSLTTAYRTFRQLKRTLGKVRSVCQRWT
jgi:hypothetical protein